MNVTRESEHAATGGANHWPLLVPPACIATWWPILAVVFNARVATICAIVAACLLVIVVGLAALAEALGFNDELLHIDEMKLPAFDEMGHPQELSR